MSFSPGESVSAPRVGIQFEFRTATRKAGPEGEHAGSLGAGPALKVGPTCLLVQVGGGTAELPWRIGFRERRAVWNVAFSWDGPRTLTRRVHGERGRTCQ